VQEIQAVARYVVFAAFAVSVLVALASWLVRTRRVSPLGRVGRTLRAASEPLIRRVETRLVRFGGNPVNAAWWLVVAVTVAGLVILSLLEWAIGAFYSVYGAFAGGPKGVLELLVSLAYHVLFVALMLRVIASWFGVFRYARWMGPVYALTDWLVEPIRRVVPPIGAVDWSPLAAWLVLWVAERMLLSFIAAF